MYLQSFDNFNVTDNNRDAFCAAMSFARESSGVFCIAGPSSSGKTHLLHAIEAAASSEPSGRKAVFYTDCYNMIPHMGKALNDHSLQSFIDGFNPYDILIIDNLEDISRLFAVQEMFLELFAAIIDRGISIASALCIRNSRPCDKKFYDKLSDRTQTENIQYNIRDIS